MSLDSKVTINSAVHPIVNQDASPPKKPEGQAEKTADVASNTISASTASSSSLIPIKTVVAPMSSASISGASTSASISSAASDMKNSVVEDKEEILKKEFLARFSEVLEQLNKELVMIDDLNTPMEMIDLILNYKSFEDLNFLQSYYESKMKIFTIERRYNQQVDNFEEARVVHLYDKITSLICGFYSRILSASTTAASSTASTDTSDAKTAAGSTAASDYMDSLDSIKPIEFLKNIYDLKLEEFRTKREKKQPINNKEEYDYVQLYDNCYDRIEEILRRLSGSPSIPTILTSSDTSN